MYDKPTPSLTESETENDGPTNRDFGKLIVRMGKTPQQAAQRLQAVDDMALSLGVSRSELIRRIADGKFLLIVPNPSLLAALANAQHVMLSALTSETPDNSKI